AVAGDAGRGALRVGRPAVQRPEHPGALRAPRLYGGGFPAWQIPAPRSRGGSAAALSPTALPRHRELQRSVQRDLRGVRPGANQRVGEHPTLRTRRGALVSTGPAVSLRARIGPARGPQSLPQGRLMIYVHASANPGLSAPRARMA